MSGVVIEELWIYPIKSCAGISVQKAELGESGFKWDREWSQITTFVG